MRTPPPSPSSWGRQLSVIRESPAQHAKELIDYLVEENAFVLQHKPLDDGPNPISHASGVSKEYSKEKNHERDELELKDEPARLAAAAAAHVDDMVDKELEADKVLTLSKQAEKVVSGIVVPHIFDSVLLSVFTSPVFLMLLMLTKAIESRNQVLTMFMTIKSNVSAACGGLVQAGATIEAIPYIATFEVRSLMISMAVKAVKATKKFLEYIVDLIVHLILLIVESKTVAVRCAIIFGWQVLIYFAMLIVKVIAAILNAIAFGIIQMVRWFQQTFNHSTVWDEPDEEPLLKQANIRYYYDYFNDVVNPTEIFKFIENLLMYPIRYALNWFMDLLIDDKIEFDRRTLGRVYVTIDDTVDTYRRVCDVNNTPMAKLSAKLLWLHDLALVGCIAGLVLTVLGSITVAMFSRWALRRRLRRALTRMGKPGEFLWRTVDPGTYICAKFVDGLRKAKHFARAQVKKLLDKKVAQKEFNISSKTHRKVARLVRFAFNPSSLTFLVFSILTFLIIRFQISFMESLVQSISDTRGTTLLYVKDLTKTVSDRLIFAGKTAAMEVDEVTQEVKRKIEEQTIVKIVAVVKKIFQAVNWFIQQVYDFIHRFFGSWADLAEIALNGFDCLIAKYFKKVHRLAKGMIALITIELPSVARRRLNIARAADIMQSHIVQEASDRGVKATQMVIGKQLVKLYEAQRAALYQVLFSAAPYLIILVYLFAGSFWKCLVKLMFIFFRRPALITVELMYKCEQMARFLVDMAFTSALSSKSYTASAAAGHGAGALGTLFAAPFIIIRHAAYTIAVLFQKCDPKEEVAPDMTEIAAEIIKEASKSKKDAPKKRKKSDYKNGVYMKQHLDQEHQNKLYQQQQEYQNKLYHQQQQPQQQYQDNVVVTGDDISEGGFSVSSVSTWPHTVAVQQQPQPQPKSVYFGQPVVTRQNSGWVGGPVSRRQTRSLSPSTQYGVQHPDLSYVPRSHLGRRDSSSGFTERYSRR